MAAALALRSDVLEMVSILPPSIDTTVTSGCCLRGAAGKAAVAAIVVFNTGSFLLNDALAAFLGCCAVVDA